MTPFEIFIKENQIVKNELAGYLGIVPSNISVYCKGGKIPEVHLRKILDNPFGWKCDALINGQHEESIDDFRMEVQIMRSELELLRDIIKNQSAIIASYAMMVDRFIGDTEDEI